MTRPVKAKVRELPIKANGVRVKQYSFSGRDFKRSDMYKIIGKYTKKLKNPENAEVSVALLYPDQWRSSGFSPAVNRIKLFRMSDYGDDEIDPEEYSRFTMYVKQREPVRTRKRKGKPRGGNDLNNDCLYQCLTKSIPKIMNEIYPTPAKFKKELGLGRIDKVPIDVLPEIEKNLKQYKLAVNGEYTYV